MNLVRFLGEYCAKMAADFIVLWGERQFSLLER